MDCFIVIVAALATLWAIGACRNYITQYAGPRYDMNPEDMYEEHLMAELARERLFLNEEIRRSGIPAEPTGDYRQVTTRRGTVVLFHSEQRARYISTILGNYVTLSKIDQYGDVKR